YEVLEPVTNPTEALKPGAPIIHPKRGTNLLSKSSLKRGDVEEAFRNSAHVLEDTYHTQRIEHLFLEPEACIAIPIPQLRAGWYSAPVGVEDDPARQLAIQNEFTRRGG